ncbi:MAG: isoprenylcysteine carboxylmethyltransferase family protein [Pseudomonadota bacterium]
MRILDIPPTWTLLHMVLAWVFSQVWSFDLPLLSAVGWLIIFAALIFAGFAVMVMARAKTTVIPGAEPTALVTAGPFKLTRNPIYLADLFIVLGWTFVVGQPLAAVLVYPLFRVLDRRFAEPEERKLEAAFGDGFKAYAGRVRRWL